MQTVCNMPKAQHAGTLLSCLAAAPGGLALQPMPREPLLSKPAYDISESSQRLRSHQGDRCGLAEL